jgi:hypothetical protein
MAFIIAYVYDYITEFCRRQVKVIQNPKVRATGQEEAKHKKYKMLKLGGGRSGLRQFKCLTDVSEGLNKLRHNLLYKPVLTGNLCIVYVMYICPHLVAEVSKVAPG